MRRKQVAIVAFIIMAVSAWVYFDLGSYLQLESVQQNIGDLRMWYADHPLLTGLIYFTIYVLATALSVPGALILTLAGGALLGFWYGLFLVSFASSIGATLAFLVSRTLLRDWVQARFSKYLGSLNEGFRARWRLLPLFASAGSNRTFCGD